MTLQEYNALATCSKCGWDSIALYYCPHPVPDGECWKYWKELDGGEHFHRWCNACKYEWVELCIQKPKEKS